MSPAGLIILGSTGSIGLSALRVVRFLKNEFSVYGLACRDDLDGLEKQIAEFSPSAAAVASPEAVVSDRYKSLKKRFPSVEFLEGEDGVAELASRKSAITLLAIVGAAGLMPGLAAIGRAERIALANKETLVMAGGIFMNRAREAGTEILPVDSEHSAVFSLLQGIPPEHIERIILTASGGGLRKREIYELAGVTPDEALAHPTWNMGRKITIDSATLVNKGLEVIEAHHLFNLDYDKIDVLIHPESVVHSMVETIDGALYAHMGEADMALPILNALKYPSKTVNPFGRLRLEEAGTLTFAECDHTRYPALSVCYEAGRCGGTAPSILNAANEVAVDAFLNRKILFTDIVKIITMALERVKVSSEPSLEDIVEADREARAVSRKIIDNGDVK
jgi:1-deoxy-D-xylulose-5-phosphate reductoisomerase